jgi:hypothetical protein
VDSVLSEKRAGRMDSFDELEVVLLSGPHHKRSFDILRSAGSAKCMAAVMKIRNAHRNRVNCGCWTCRAHPDL